MRQNVVSTSSRAACLAILSFLFSACALQTRSEVESSTSASANREGQSSNAAAVAKDHLRKQSHESLDLDMDGQVDRREMRAFASEDFRARDFNKDGKIVIGEDETADLQKTKHASIASDGMYTKTEYVRLMEAALTRMDTDDNGRISLKEYNTAMK